MKTLARFWEWIQDIPNIKARAQDQKLMDAMIAATFKTANGKIALDYLIARHYAIVTAPSMLSEVQFNEGRRAVIHEIISAIDRDSRSRRELEVKTEVKVHG